jgi:hypothetical protein
MHYYNLCERGLTGQFKVMEAKVMAAPLDAATLVPAIPKNRRTMAPELAGPNLAIDELAAATFAPVITSG